MNKSIDNMKNEYENVIADIPERLNEKISIIKENQKKMFDLLSKENYKKIHAKYTEMFSKVDKLSNRFVNYIEKSGKISLDDQYSKSFNKINAQVEKFAPEIRQRIREDVMEYLKNKETEDVLNKKTSNLKFTAVLSDFEEYDSVQHSEYGVMYNNSLIQESLDRVDERIKDIQDNISLLEHRNAERMKMSTALPSSVISQIDNIHQRLLDAQTIMTSIVPNRKMNYKKLSTLMNERSPFVDTQTVTKMDFVKWGEDLSDSIDFLDYTVKEFGKKFETSLDTVENRITELSEKITQAEMNIRNVEQLIDDESDFIDSKADELSIEIENIPKISNENLNNIYEKYKMEFSKTREDMFESIKQIKAEIDEAERMFQEYNI